MSDEHPTDDAAQPSAAETPTPETPAAPAPAPETPAAPAETPAEPTPVPVASETPAAPETPAPVAETPPPTPAEPAPAAPAAPVQAQPAPVQAQPAPVAEPVAAAPATSNHVAVPKWVLATVAAIVGAALMFGIGYAVGDSSSDSDSNGSTAIGTPFDQDGNGGQPAPSFPGRGDGNQNDGGQRAPQAPSQTDGAFLGVATRQTVDGLEIVEVVSGSAADDAGLEVGDVIVGFDGNDVTTPAQLANAVSNLDPGDEVEVDYERNGSTRTASVELGTRSATSN